MTELARSLAGADDPGAAFFQFIGTLVDEGVAKRDLVDALTAAGFDVTRSTLAVVPEFRAAIAVILSAAQGVGAVRDDVGVPELMALLGGLSMAMRDAGDTDLPHRVLAVVTDGLRPSRRDKS
jgi:hypothetical protein